MLFQSYSFAILLATTLLLAVLLPGRWRNRAILAASYIFYGAWDWRFCFLLFGTSTLDFVCALAADKEGGRDDRLRHTALCISLASNLGVLAFFKYWGFLTSNLQSLLASLGMHVNVAVLDVILPIGISFYTFQSMAYVIDVYRGRMRASADYETFLTYVAFFPQLVAGPIERAPHLYPQIERGPRVSREGIRSGAALFLLGLFKKMVVADNAAHVANHCFAVKGAAWPLVLLGGYAFAVQIFCDFSGYTDMARGAARMLGVDLMENFRFPFLARNPQQFWSNWHISLSTWLRDYLYIPLGGNRCPEWRVRLNLFLTMALGGLWHGAAMNYVLWGFFHGALLVGHRMLFGRTDQRDVTPEDVVRPSHLAMIFLFFHLNLVGWILFRSSSYPLQYADALGSFFRAGTPALVPGHDVVVVVLCYLAVFLIHFFQLAHREMEFWTRWVVPARVAGYAALVLALLYLCPRHDTPFIYFKF